jgi:hypothetical protein
MVFSTLYSPTAQTPEPSVHPTQKPHQPTRFGPKVMGVRSWLSRSIWCTIFICFALLAMPAKADPVSLPVFEINRNDDELALNFSAKFELSAAVEDALQKGVPLVFVAEAKVRGTRWYWRDKRINTATRSWRLSYQPLTRKYRVSFGGLAQSFETLTDALSNLNSSAHWKLADTSQLGSGTYIEFSYELDTTQLPRPMQMGIAGQTDWQLRVERMQRLP